MAIYFEDIKENHIAEFEQYNGFPLSVGEKVTISIDNPNSEIWSDKSFEKEYVIVSIYHTFEKRYPPDENISRIKEICNTIIRVK